MRFDPPPPAGLFELVVDLHYKGLPVALVTSVVADLHFDLLAPKDNHSEEHYWDWAHRLDAPWPGNYAQLWMRWTPPENALFVRLTVTIDNPAFAEGCRALVRLMDALADHGPETGLWLNGDDVYTSPSRPLTPRRLRALLDGSHIVVDPAFEIVPWPRRCLDFRVRGRGERSYFFERADRPEH